MASARDIDTDTHPTASSIMDPHPDVLHPNDTIGDGIRSIMEHRYRRLPVVDEQGRFLGIFGVRCLMRLALPKAVIMDKGLESVPYVRESLADLHRRLKAYEHEPVSSATHLEKVTVSPDTHLTETLLTLYKTRASLPVVDPASGKLVGVISYFDAVRRILDAGS